MDDLVSRDFRRHLRPWWLRRPVRQRGGGQKGGGTEGGEKGGGTVEGRR